MPMGPSGGPSLISNISNSIFSHLFLDKLARLINFIELFKETAFGFTGSPPPTHTHFDFLLSISLVSALICVISFLLPCFVFNLLFFQFRKVEAWFIGF